MFQKSALDLWHDECAQRPIITGSRRLDAAIGNGVPVKVITEFCGPPGSGKTQLCLQLCVNVQIPDQLGGLAGTAVYIGTEHVFSAQRLREIGTACVDHLRRIQGQCAASATDGDCMQDYTVDRILDNVLCTYVSTYTELLAAVEHLKHRLGTDGACAGVRLIVIDSLVGPFRHGLSSYDRVRVLYALLDDLDAIARRHRCAVVLTNEITTRVPTVGRAYLVPALGDTHAHRVGQQIALGRDIGAAGMFVADVRKSLYSATSSVVFKITADGIRDV